MVSAKALSVALLGLSAAVTGSPVISEKRAEEVYDPAIWTSIEVHGKMLHYKTAAFHPSGTDVSTLGSNTTVTAGMTARGPLQKRDNRCGASSFQPAPFGGPYSTVQDCWILRDWLVGFPAFWDVPSHWAAPYQLYTIVDYSTCRFKAGTGNVLRTLIGNEDMADLIRDSIGYYAIGGYVGAKGNMGCWNFLGSAGTASVDWAIAIAPDA